jgi:hypothetical protein
MDLLFRPIKEVELLEKILQAYMKNCFSEYKTFILKKSQYGVKKADIIYALINNDITKKEFLTKMNNLDDEHFNSDYYRKFADCIITKSYKIAKKNLDYYLSEIPEVKYKKPIKYNTDDFIKIMRLYYYTMTTMKFIKSNALTNIIKLNDKIRKS